MSVALYVNGIAASWKKLKQNLNCFKVGWAESLVSCELFNYCLHLCFWEGWEDISSGIFLELKDILYSFLSGMSVVFLG